MDEKFKELIDYARGGAPTAGDKVAGVGRDDYPPSATEKLVQEIAEELKPAWRKPATVTPLQPKAAPILQDEILEALDALTADIRSGKVVPSHLIIGWGTSTRYGDEDATSYVFDSFGLNRWETIGHLHAYASRLAIGGDVE